MTSPPRATIRLTWACGNRCVFCAQEGIADATIGRWDEALVAAANAADEVTFVGGDPLESRDLEAAIRRAVELGFTAVGVQTNASTLDRDRIEALAEAGLTDVHVSIHGADAATHDYHVGREGRFDALKAALVHLRKAGIATVASTVITRSNYRTLGELPRALLDAEVAAWVCWWPHAAGRGAEAFDRVVPRLGLAMPFVLHALQRSRDLGLPAVVAGAPLCALGPYAAHRLSARRRFHPPACSDCAARPHCPGVDQAYIERFAESELRPRETATISGPLPAALARMFVGVGPLAPRAVTDHPSPAHVRARLQVLGRPNPGAAEQRKRSAVPPEALERIFPDLFVEAEPEPEPDGQ